MTMRLGARWWYSSMTVSWGIVATCAAAIKDRTGLAMQRFFLGITEAGAAWWSCCMAGKGPATGTLGYNSFIH